MGTSELGSLKEEQPWHSPAQRGGEGAGPVLGFKPVQNKLTWHRAAVRIRTVR